jgi:hypothetical protein
VNTGTRFEGSGLTGRNILGSFVTGVVFRSYNVIKDHMTVEEFSTYGRDDLKKDRNHPLTVNSHGMGFVWLAGRRTRWLRNVL